MLLIMRWKGVVDGSASHTLRYLGPSGDLAKMQIPIQKFWSWGLRFCFSNKPTAEADAASSQATPSSKGS